MFGNSTKIFDNRYDERNAFLAADFFGFAFWIAGDEWAVGAGRGLRGPKNADVVVDLALERICIDETIDAHGSEEMADAFPTLRSGISWRSANGGANGPQFAPPSTPQSTSTMTASA